MTILVPVITGKHRKKRTSNERTIEKCVLFGLPITYKAQGGNNNSPNLTGYNKLIASSRRKKK